MNDCISNEIEKASEKIVAFDENQVQGWLFSPQFLVILSWLSFRYCRYDLHDVEKEKS